MLFHEPTWRLWFKYAEGLVPIEPFRSSGCNSSVFADINKYCLADAGSTDVIAQQHLFDVYVHTAPSFPGFEKGSVFYGKEIANRVEVSLPPSQAMTCPASSTGKEVSIRAGGSAGHRWATAATAGHSRYNDHVQNSITTSDWEPNIPCKQCMPVHSQAFEKFRYRGSEPVSIPDLCTLSE